MQKLTKLHLTVMILITTLMGHAFVKEYTEVTQLKRNGKTTSGDIHRGYKWTNVQYNFYVNGQFYRGKSKGSGSRWDITETLIYPEEYLNTTQGQAITIIYDQNNPNINRPVMILNYNKTIGLGIIFFTIFLILLGWKRINTPQPS